MICKSHEKVEHKKDNRSKNKDTLMCIATRRYCTTELLVGGWREGRLLGRRILWVEGGKVARPSDIVGGGREGC